MLGAAIIPGVLIGAALGLLGGGGSVLAVPIFVYVLGFEAKKAIAMSLAVVAATSALGTASHWRAGHVNLRVGVMFGTVATFGTMAGVRLSEFVSGTTQLVALAAVMLIAAVFMVSGRMPPGRSGHSVEPRPVAAFKIVPASLLVGTLTGMVGVGGGFLIVPALMLVGTTLHEAVGTSLLIITATCVVAFLGYLGQVSVDWRAMTAVAAGTLPGIAVGSYLHRLVPPLVLRRGFAAFLVAIATMILVERFAPLGGV